MCSFAAFCRIKEPKIMTRFPLGKSSLSMYNITMIIL